jgi:hypothetical protein
MCLDLPSGFLTKTLYAFLFFPIHATCPVHLIFLDWILIIMWLWGNKAFQGQYVVMKEKR